MIIRLKEWYAKVHAMDEEEFGIYILKPSMVLCAIIAISGMIYAAHIMNGFNRSYNRLVEAEKIWRTMQQEQSYCEKESRVK